MTLVLSIHSRDTLWLLTDRRLSYGRGRPPVDDAVKVVDLETSDGVALLAYAGIGATPRGTQPSTWMSGVLRGRGNLTMEEALGTLADAARNELPRYLARLPGGTHNIIVPAFVRNVGSRLYSIDNYVDTHARQHFYRYTSHQRSEDPGSPSARLGLGGSGGQFLLQMKSQAWQRFLFSLVKAHDHGKLSEYAVADHLAELNLIAHRGVKDGSVGPRCIVVWRRRPGVKTATGSAHQFYSGSKREPDTGSIPAIGLGLDINALIGVLLQFEGPALTGFTETGKYVEPDREEMNRLLDELPSDPDERLR